MKNKRKKTNTKNYYINELLNKTNEKSQKIKQNIKYGWTVY